MKNSDSSSTKALFFFLVNIHLAIQDFKVGMLISFFAVHYYLFRKYLFVSYDTSLSNLIKVTCIRPISLRRL